MIDSRKQNALLFCWPMLETTQAEPDRLSRSVLSPAAGVELIPRALSLEEGEETFGGEFTPVTQCDPEKRKEGNPC